MAKGWATARGWGRGWAKGREKGRETGWETEKGWEREKDWEKARGRLWAATDKQQQGGAGRATRR
jgi:hypothetical protein